MILKVIKANYHSSHANYRCQVQERECDRLWALHRQRLNAFHCTQNVIPTEWHSGAFSCDGVFKCDSSATLHSPKCLIYSGRNGSSVGQRCGIKYDCISLVIFMRWIHIIWNSALIISVKRYFRKREAGWGIIHLLLSAAGFESWF